MWCRYDSHLYKGPLHLKTCKSRWIKSLQNPKYKSYNLSLKPILWTGERASLDLLAPQEIKESCTEYSLEQLQNLSYSEPQHKKSAVLGSLNKHSRLIHQKMSTSPLKPKETLDGRGPGAAPYPPSSRVSEHSAFHQTSWNFTNVERPPKVCLIYPHIWHAATLQWVEYL